MCVLCRRVKKSITAEGSWVYYEKSFSFWRADTWEMPSLHHLFRSVTGGRQQLWHRCSLWIFSQHLVPLLTHLSSDIQGVQTPYSSKLVMEGFPSTKKNRVGAPATQHLRGNSEHSLSGTSWASLWITALLVLGVLQVQVPPESDSPARSHLSPPTPSPDIDPQFYLVDHHRSRLNPALCWQMSNHSMII